jgi:hypothetical protein
LTHKIHEKAGRRRERNIDEREELTQ